MCCGQLQPKLSGATISLGSAGKIASWMDQQVRIYSILAALELAWFSHKQNIFHTFSVLNLRPSIP